IFIALNLNHNRNTGFSPIEMLLHKSPFDITEKCLEEEIIKKINDERNRKIKDITNNNKSRLKHDFKKYEYVYLRNNHPDKIEDKWLGPYFIIETYDNNTVDIMKNDKVRRVSVKNAKPCWSEGRMSCTDDSLKNMPTINIQKFLEILKYKNK
ncbi:hypothetical protein DMUE_4926, partial [Dictyocoela muelleri]